MAGKSPEYGFRLAGDAFRPEGANFQNVSRMIPRINLAARRGLERVAPPEEKEDKLKRLRKRFSNQLNPERKEKNAVDQSAFAKYRDLL